MDFQQALALHHQGRMAEAAGAYQLVLQADPVHLDALIYLGALRLGQGQPGEAEALLRRAVTLSSESVEALGNLAAALQALGRYDEAVEHYQRALARNPALLDARFGLAASLQASRQNEAAIASYETILAAEPAHPEANYGLATLLALLGRSDEAAMKFRAVLAADPDFAEASFALGKLRARDNAHAEAISCFLQALDVDPDYIEARVALGIALSQLDRDTEAMAAFSAVLAIEPDNADAHNGIGLLLDRKQLHTEAIQHYRTVLVRQPDHVDALAGMANTLKNLGRHAEALALARKVVVMRPNFAPAASLLGSILAELGSIDEAEAEHRRSAALAPDRPETLYHLTLLTRVRRDDGTLDALEAMLPRVGSLPPREQSLILFALAKAYDDIGERDLGFDYLLKGNATKRSQTNYNEPLAVGAMKRVAQVFTAEFIATRQGLGDSSTTPVFIVGMPRSGTTLVEQTLASHAAVFGAGERLELSRAIGRMSAARLGATAYPEAVWTVSGEQFHQMGAEYVAALRPLAPGAARIVDKMPANFLFAGMICLMLPNARIIHTRRAPVDTCLSCFSKLFAGEQAFTYDLAELGRYYRAYEGLMAHWQNVLPPGVMLEVDYATLVDEFEREARRIVAHCGLEWDPACLEFHKTDRAVHTASMTQVRQPIYRTSVGRWRPKDALLQPLLEGLAGRER